MYVYWPVTSIHVVYSCYTQCTTIGTGNACNHKCIGTLAHVIQHARTPDFKVPVKNTRIESCLKEAKTMHFH